MYHDDCEKIGGIYYPDRNICVVIGRFEGVTFRDGEVGMKLLTRIGELELLGEFDPEMLSLLREKAPLKVEINYNTGDVFVVEEMT